MKYCKDCKYYERFQWDYWADCQHDKSFEDINPVNGKSRFHLARKMREETSSCGPEALLFKPNIKYAILQRLHLL